MRIVHYVNQSYAGLGGEDTADLGPRVLNGPAGPGEVVLGARLGPRCLRQVRLGPVRTPVRSHDVCCPCADVERPAVQPW
ncbi:MAG: glycine/sarcosine/betaine reductase selenoprotein B family protein [Pseudonocardia sp.]